MVPKDQKGLAVNTALENLGSALPPILYRNNPRFKELVGLSPRTMANLDCLGLGPAEKVCLGRLVGYPRQALLTWLGARMTVAPRRAR